MRRLVLSIVVFGSTLLGGCAVSVPETHQYLLETAALPAGALTGDPDAPVLAIYEVALPGFLAGSGIVYQINANEVNVAVNHRWAEPLARQLRRGLYTSLAKQADEFAVFEAPNAAAADGYRLTVEIDAFQGHYRGVALIAGSWRLQGPMGNILIRHRFRREAALQSDGYPALVRALSRGWRQVATGIASSVQAGVSAPKSAVTKPKSG